MNKTQLIEEIVAIATKSILLETGLSALPRLLQKDIDSLRKELSDFVDEPCNKGSTKTCLNQANQSLLSLVGSILVKDPVRKATGVYGKIFSGENQQLKMILPAMIQNHYSISPSFGFPDDDHKAIWSETAVEMGLESFVYLFEIYYEIVQYNSESHACE